MMKYFFPLIALLIFSNAYSQVPDWVWCQISNSIAGNFGEGESIATDNADNVYITGFYSGSITFGTYVFSNHQGAFLAKYDSDGNLIWADGNMGGDAYGWAMCTDNSGHEYIAGTFEASILFGSHILSSFGNFDNYLVKYDSSGNVIWARSCGGTNQDNVRSVSIDLSGNVYVLGDYNSPQFTIGPYTFTNSGGLKIFLAKYDSSGNVLWARSTSYGGGYAYGTTTDAFGNIFISGNYYTDSVSFGTHVLYKMGNGDIFIAKYDSSGNALWARSEGTTGEDDCFFIATDAFNNAYITGRYKSASITFGAYTLTNSNPNDFDAYLVKYDDAGNVLWAKNIGDSLYESGFNISVAANKIYLTGGFASQSVSFDTIALPLPLGSTDAMFIAGYDLSGNVLFAKGEASGGDDNCPTAVSKSSFCFYIGGDFMPNVLVLGNDTLIISGGNENVFVGKLCYPPIGEFISKTEQNNAALYPNPFSNSLNISVKEDVPTELILYDMFSQIILEKKFNYSTTLNTEEITNGIYIYQLRTKNGTVAQGILMKE